LTAILGGTHDIADRVKPVIRALDIVETTAEKMKILATLDATNPTNYSVTIPYADVHVLVNGTMLGHATVKDLAVVPGVNGNLSATAEWQPVGKQGIKVGRELLSQYISGMFCRVTMVDADCHRMERQSKRANT
jgi:hypothetical protein